MRTLNKDNKLNPFRLATTRHILHTAYFYLVCHEMPARHYERYWRDTKTLSVTLTRARRTSARVVLAASVASRALPLDVNRGSVWLVVRVIVTSGGLARVSQVALLVHVEAVFPCRTRVEPAQLHGDGHFTLSTRQTQLWNFDCFLFVFVTSRLDKYSHKICRCCDFQFLFRVLY